MDMEEYFDYTQEKLKKIIKEVKGIGVSDYHPMIKKGKSNPKLIPVNKLCFNDQAD